MQIRNAKNNFNIKLPRTYDGVSMLLFKITCSAAYETSRFGG